MNRRLVRSLSVCCLLPIAGCGYFSGNWPALEQDPLPERAESEARPAGEVTEPATPTPDIEAPSIQTQDEAADRLADYETRLATLRIQAEDTTEALDETPRSPTEWGQTQLDASRLTRTEGDLRALGDDVARDADYLEQRADFTEAAARYRSLALQIASLVDRVSERRRSVQAELAGNRPEEAPAPASPATPLPQGNPALTISADAEAETYSRAVSTLVEKAQAINSTNVYHVVAAADDTAAMRAENVHSLLQAGGVAETRIRMLTDPAATPGSLRIFVE